MNIQQMRKIDSGIGGILCILLSIYNKILTFFSPRKSPDLLNSKTILITKYLGIGSIILLTPMVRALRTVLPQVRIVLLTFESNAEFAKQIEIFDEVLSIRNSNLFHFTFDFFKVIYLIHNKNFDVVLDLEFFARFSTIVSYLSGVKVRIGYYLPRLWRGSLLTHHIHFNPYRHVTEIFSAQLQPFGITVSDFTLTPPKIDETAITHVREKLSKLGTREEDQKISVNINASDLSKERKWPKNNFIELINYIAHQRKDVKLILVGSKNETEDVAELYNSLCKEAQKRVINLCGMLNIKEFIALLKQSDLFITNDSGPLHIASALSIPTVSFYGPESPSLYGPVGKKNIVFYAGIYCSPCLNVYNAKTAMCNGKNICMEGIKVENVIEILREKKIV